MSKTEDLTAKEERCVLRVKAQLRKDHPDWDAKRVKVSAIKICRASIDWNPTSQEIMDLAVELEDFNHPYSDSPVAAGNSVAKLDKDVVNYKKSKLIHGRCDNCEYYLREENLCSIVKGDIQPEDTCDALSVWYNVTSYSSINPEDLEDFVRGIVETAVADEQVLDIVDTPVGALVLIEEGSGHRYSISLDHLLNESQRLRHWDEAEAQKILKVGKTANRENA